MVYTGNEIITFQFGHYSNFIGTHWWNCQEAGFVYTPDTLSEINHDVLFREGQTFRGEVTFTPRLLLVDLKGSLGSLPANGRLYDPPEAPDPSIAHWPVERVTVENHQINHNNDFLQDLEQGEVSVASLAQGLKEKGEAVPKLYDLDETVKSWSDFLRPHLHPRSITVVEEYQHNDTSMLFETFPQGQKLWASPTFNEEFTDRIRLYMEETDNLQGYQLLMDSGDGFSGLACAGLQQLRDDYPSKATICWTCQSPQTPPNITARQVGVRLVNQVLALSCLSEHAGLFLPVSGTTSAWKLMGDPIKFPHLNYKSEMLYHTSAITACAVDTVSLLYRLRTSNMRLGDLTAGLSGGQRRAAALSVTAPLPLYRQATLLDALEAWDGPLTHSLTPTVDVNTDTVWQEAYVLRGLPESRLMRNDQVDLRSSNPAYSCTSLGQLLKTYLEFNGQSTAGTRVVTAESPLKTSAPFPHIFDSHITVDGQLNKEPRPSHLGVDSVPVLAGMHVTSIVGSLLQTLHTEARKVDVRTLPQFAASGLESTELSESFEQLLCLSENYSDHQMDF